MSKDSSFAVSDVSSSTVCSFSATDEVPAECPQKDSASLRAAPAPPIACCVIGDADNLHSTGPSPYMRPGVDTPSADTPPTLISSVAENEQTVEKETSETAKEESFDILNPEADLVEGAPQKERRRLALVAGGNMESNASPSRSRFSGRKAAPLFQKTGVAEHGDNSSYGIPLTIGIGLKWNFTPHWALGTGIGYSYLSRSFTGTYTEMNDGLLVRQVTADIDNGLQYLGIPLNLYYQFSDTRPVQFYAFTGMTVEKGIQNRFRIKDAAGDILYRESVPSMVTFRITSFSASYWLASVSR